MSVGVACAESVGIAAPFASFGSHVFCDSLHQSPLAQSASTLHPPDFSHLPSLLQAPERHTVAPFAVVHGPSPSAKPHLSSVLSHAPDRQTPLPPSVSEQVPSPLA